jgi:transcriptional regulator with XRE-family HTH domain
MDRRQKAVAEFLRSRRERLKPADVGLHSGVRRRTPGLRREEVAALAGIGTGWYTFLEQGRDVQPSEAALLRIAGALRLDPAEERYLLKLAFNPTSCPRAQEVVQPELSRAIRSVGTPAMVLGCAWDVLGHNEALDAMYDVRFLPYRNHLRLMFTPEFRLLCVDWELRARQFVGAFRDIASPEDPRVSEVVNDLLDSSAEFRAWWAEQGVREENSGSFALDHPFVGRLKFDFVMLGLLDSPGMTMRLYSCADEKTQHGLDELTRQLRRGERSPQHNLWTALAARVRSHACNGHAA